MRRISLSDLDHVRFPVYITNINLSFCFLINISVHLDNSKATKSPFARVTCTSFKFLSRLGPMAQT